MIEPEQPEPEPPQQPPPPKEDTPLTFNIQQNANVPKKKRVTRSTIATACILLWTDIIGVGPLASGYYMAKGGVWFTVATTILVAIISDYTLNLMFILVHKYKQQTYVDMCAYALGRKGRFFASLFIFTYNFTALVANLMVIGTAVPHLLSQAIGHDYLVFSRQFVLAFATALLLPVAFMKDIARFVVACSITICFFLCAVGILLYESIRMNIDTHFTGFKNDLTFVEPYCLQVLGGICYVFICHDMSFSVAATLVHPTRRRWSSVVRFCIGANLFVSLSVGLLSYAIFVQDTEAFIPGMDLCLKTFYYLIEPFADSYPPSFTLANFARLFILTMIISVVPYLCYLPRLALYQLVYCVVDKSIFTNKKETILHITLTLLTPIGALVIAELVSDLGLVLSLAGGFSAAGLGFIMPPAVFLALEDGQWHNSHKLPYVTIFLFGLFCVGLTLYSASTLIIYR